MYAFDCPHCGNRSLIFESQVTAIRSDQTGIHVSIICWCGVPGEIHTGRARAAEEPQPLAA